MKKTFSSLCILLAASLFSLAHAQLTVENLPPTDTFRIQNFPLKIWLGDTRVRKLKAVEPTVLSKNDALVNRDWSTGKTFRGAGLGVQGLGVVLMGVGFLKTLKGEDSGSLLVGGAGVALGGVIMQVVGAAKAKKAMRRYNAIHAGRIEAMPTIFKQPAAPEKPAAPDAPPVETRRAATTEQSTPSAKPAPATPRFVNAGPKRKWLFFENDSTDIGQLKPTVNEPGFAIKASGLRGMIWENRFDSLTFQFRKTKPNNIIWRADLSLAFRSEKSSDKNVFPSGYRYNSESSRQFALGIAPGVERHFPGTRRLDPYVGMALPLAFVGKFRSTEVDDDVDNDGTYRKEETKTTLPGGFGIGLDGFAGLNYYVARRLALGLEYNLGISLLRIGGKTKYKSTVKNKPTPTSNETTTITENEDDEISFSTAFIGNKGVAGLNLIFYLGR